ncbi:MAG TPA: T9SS type A sorting domain-containing protein [bacterium]
MNRLLVILMLAIASSVFAATTTTPTQWQEDFGSGFDSSAYSIESVDDHAAHLDSAFRIGGIGRIACLTSFDVTDFEASFDFRSVPIPDRCPGDGMVFWWYPDLSFPGPVGGYGGYQLGWAWSDVIGQGIKFHTLSGTLAIVTHGVGNEVASCSYPQMGDAEWHHVRVRFQNGSTSVFVNDTLLLSATLPVEFSHGVFVFSAGGGNCHSWHWIDNVDAQCSVALPDSTTDLLIGEYSLSMTQYSEVQSVPLESGKPYYLKVIGNYGIAHGWSWLDAAYCWGICTPPLASDQYGDPTWCWMWNNNWHVRPTPDVYTPDHVYYYPFIGTGEAEVFSFSDPDSYWDNSGGLTIQVWKRAASDSTLPVELTSFSAVPASSNIRLSFTLASETDNDRFEIWRSTTPNSNFSLLTAIASQGNSATPHSYDFTDRAVTGEQTYWYYLADVDISGNRTEHKDLTRSATVRADNGIPTSYSLAAYPNPFNPATTITFSLPIAEHVQVTIYDVAGRRVCDVADGLFAAGIHRVTFDGAQLPSGVYVAQMKTAATTHSTKLLLLK